MGTTTLYSHRVHYFAREIAEDDKIKASVNKMQGLKKFLVRIALGNEPKFFVVASNMDEAIDIVIAEEGRYAI